VRPSATEFGRFATAIAGRYSGQTAGLPRVRYWEVWNEPNVSLYLMPQYQGGRAVAAVWYRKLVNSFSDAVHRVHDDNVVIAGGLSPFSVRNRYVDTASPLGFMRSLLCLSAGAVPRPTCDDPVRFDAWSVHPYTSGGPTHHAYNHNDLSLGDLPKVRPLLQAALRLGHLKSAVPVQFWVTEFSWDTKPPDPNGVPVDLQARWVAEALYHAWNDGVSMFTWFTLRDQPLKTSDFQSGLYFRGRTVGADRAKPTLTAFSFPFVAYRQANGVFVWGRTPSSTAGTVAIEARTAGATTTVAYLHADRYGIFNGVVRKGATATDFRARSATRTSLEFALTPPANENLPATPFGVGSRK
ncbi:MAG: hypothetical protein ACRDM1_02985, partial [Gaiellaceae bacterium]